jgi:hypothetical protein
MFSASSQESLADVTARDGKVAVMDTLDQNPGSDQHPARGRRSRVRWQAGGVAILLAVGVISGLALAGNTTAPADQAAPTGAAGPAAPVGPTGQAAELNALLSSAASPSSSPPASSLAGASPGGPAAAAAPQMSGVLPAAGRCVRVIRRLRLAGLTHAARVVRRHCRYIIRRYIIRRRIGRWLLGSMHGEFTFRTSDGIAALAFERGVIESVTGASVVVRAADGTTWTWDLVSNSVVRENGALASADALAGGERVFVGGPVTDGAKDARLIVIGPGG